jgi:peptidoglycan/LPS O-acetylase OafA/YrhL
VIQESRLRDRSQSPAATAQNAENPGGFRHVPALDGIRGAAILLVLIDHLFWANNNTGHFITDLLSQVRGATYCGVNLFFALSGFLITGILLDSLHMRHYFRTFYARRTLRIFPLYYGVLFVLLLLTRPLHLTWSGWQYYYLTYSANLALWPVGPLELGFFNINHFWSLQVEEQFYLVWPLIVYRIRHPEPLVRTALSLCAVVLAIRIFLVAMRSHPPFDNHYLVYSPTFSCADNILFGCALAAVLRTRLRQRILQAAPFVFWTALAILFLVAIPNGGLEWGSNFLPGSIFISTIGFSLMGAASAALIAMTLTPGRAQSLFSNSILRFFGRYSYGLYVYHYSVSGLFLHPLRAFFYTHLHSKGLAVLLEGMTSGAVSLTIAILSYHLFEIRFLHLKRFFAYSRRA